MNGPKSVNWSQKSLGRTGPREIGTAHEFYMGGPTNFEEFTGVNAARDQRRAWRGVVEAAWQWAVVIRLGEYDQAERQRQFSSHEHGRKLRLWWDALKDTELPFALKQWAHPQGESDMRFLDLAFDLHQVDGRDVTLRQKLVEFDLLPPKENS